MNPILFTISYQCQILCDPMHHSLPGTSVRGIFLKRILDWADISSSRGSSWPKDQIPCVSCIGRQILYHWTTWEAHVLLACLVSHFSHVLLFAMLWTIAQQTPPSMGFSAKNTGLGCHSLLQGIFLTQDRIHVFCDSCIASGFFTAESTWEAPCVTQGT